MIDFDGQVAIVTGGAAGLGAAYARELGSRGARVVVNDLSPAAEGVVDEITAAGGIAAMSIRDIATREGADGLIADTMQAFGAVHAVVNNAGLLRDADVEAITDEDWHRVIAVNLDAPFFVSRAAWPHFREQGYGRLVFVTSASGLFGNVGHAFYSAAKAGVVGVMKALALEGRDHGILANAVAPLAVTAQSLAKTPSTSSRTSARDLVGPRFDSFTPEHVAHVVAVLAHRDCTETGSVIAAAGGVTRRVLVATSRGADFGDEGADVMLDRWAEVGAGMLDTPASLRDDMLLLRARLEADRGV